MKVIYVDEKELEALKTEIARAHERIDKLCNSLSLAVVTSLPNDASQAYISKYGILRVPDRVRAILGISEGSGGVVFVEENGEVKLLSDEQYMDKLGLKDGDR